MQTEHVSTYELSELVDETSAFEVYNAWEEDHQNTFKVKIPKTDHFTPSELARLKHEYEIIRHADIEGVVKILDIVPHHRSFALIMEEFNGISIKELLATGPIPLIDFLNIAIRLAEALGNLHQNNIIHNAIKPLNILIDKRSGKVKIADLGISAGMAGEYAEILRSDLDDDTLAYMSPEQTGRMNRTVDYRTDFYSLGVLFYHMLTGEVPLKSDDPLELIHAHIAKNPIPPEILKPSIPGPVSRIIMKLLSKTAEERYQNSFGLMADLIRCRDKLKYSSSIEEFELGLHDISIKLNISQKIYGREKELNLLLKAFERVSAGSNEIILVVGHPGIGKTALVQEAFKPITAQRGYFTGAKYEQFRKNVPYSAIIQSIKRLIRQILSEDEKRVQEWRERISEALGPNGRIITDDIPEVELLIGKQSEVAALDPDEAENRFNLVFKNFIRVFSTQEHPVTLFLDDLQWADTASLKLIITLITDADLHHFLLIGTYRDNEVHPTDPLMITMQVVQKSGIPVHTIALPPLDVHNVNAMISELLRCGEEASLPLAKLVHDKTDGNPFFMNQFLRTLYDEHLLQLEPGTGWQRGMAGIKQMQVTDNVLDLMAQKIARLSPNTARILQVCACVGNRFDLELLSSVVGKSIDETLDDLSEAITVGLIAQAGTSYVFQHDRILEVATSLIPAKQRVDLHYQIGTAILANTADKDLHDNIFYIANQLNQGVERITTTPERIKLARLNLMAGKKARNSTAHASAVMYLRAGIELLPENSWQTEYELTYALYKERMECEYLNRNYQESKRFFDVLIGSARSTVDKAEAYRILVVLYTTIGQYETAIRLGKEGMKLFGITLPDHPSKLSVMLPLLNVRRLLERKTIEEILQMPDIQDEVMKEFVRLADAVAMPVYYLNPLLFVTIVLMINRITLRLGNLDCASVAYNSLASILREELGLYDLSYRIGEMARKLSNRYPTSKYRGNVLCVFAYLNQHWKRHARDNIEVLREAYKLCLQSGEFTYAAHSINVMAMQRVIIGDNLDDVFSEYKHYEAFVKAANDPFTAQYFSQNIHFYMCLKGLTASRASINTDDFDANEQLEKYRQANNTLGIFYHLLIRTRLYYLFGEYQASYNTGLEIEKIIDVALGDLHVTEYYFYHALSMTALYGNAPAIEKKTIRKKIKAYLKLMKTWSEHCPENFLHKYLMIKAEQARMRNRHEEAMDLYRRAITSAKENDYTQNQGIANELAARYYISRGYHELARPHITEARLAYLTWGATAKVRDLEEKYPQFIPREEKNEKITPGETPPDSKAIALEGIDLKTVIKISHTLSGEIDLEQLITRLLEIAIENAGAQKGCILLERAKELRIESQGIVDDQGVMLITSAPGASIEYLPQSIINYVRRTGEQIVLGNASLDETFGNDPSIISRRIRSVLCMPIKEKNRVIGILYLENNLLNDAFTRDRIEILDILTSQATISMKNALLYADRKQAQEQLLAEKEWLSVTLRSIGEGVIATGTNKLITLMNKAAEQLTGWKQNEAAGRPFSEVFRIMDEKTRAALNDDPLKPVFSKNAVVEDPGTPVLAARDGTEKVVSYTISPINDHIGKIIGAIVVFHDITEKQKAEAALRESEQRFRTIFDSFNDAVFVHDLATGDILDVNDTMCAMYGYSREEAFRLKIGDLSSGEPPYSHQDAVAWVKKATTTGAQVFEWRAKDKGGRLFWVEVTMKRATIGGQDRLVIAARDITERKLAEEERARLENQLLHAQKMESVGRLAGGVAHDFNNMLSVILGCVELMKFELPPDHPLMKRLTEIEQAGWHSRDITRQLLAFSRKQVIAPKPVNLNELIASAQKTVARLIGEDIDFRFHPGKNLWKIKIDPTQIDQILVNLTVNARDAMPKGGTLTIETENVSLAEDFCREHIELIPGQYVRLVVSDSGTGMDQNSMSHLFEPFFTTKELGKGTGLGLATVYGIVKQNKGFINVFSEPGRGTTFKIYLVKFVEEDRVEKSDEPPVVASGVGTVLLVEDNEMVRDMTAAMLKAIGYTVLDAATPADALALCQKKNTPIDLLMTDVVMPGLSGPALKDRIEAIRPGIKVLFMSGYTPDVIIHHGVLEDGVHFIQKPFKINDLATKIQQVLGDK